MKGDVLYTRVNPSDEKNEAVKLFNIYDSSDLSPASAILQTITDTAK